MSEYDDTLDPTTIREAQPLRPAIAPKHVRLDIGATTHVGKKRTNNEDHFLVARLARTLSTLATNLPDDGIPAGHDAEAYAMLVADGMGGAEAGEVASRVAIKGIVDLAVETPDWIMRFDERSRPELLRRFGERFRLLREALVERARAEPSLAGMGTTLTLACSAGADLVIAHAGDSRAYLLRGDGLHQLTRDHTMAQRLADAGVIRPEDVAKHPMAHMLTNVLGTHEGTGVSTELHHLVLEHGDQVLLCTDGLSDMVADATVASVLQRAASAAQACDELLGLALEAGGRDNVTIIVARYDLSG